MSFPSVVLALVMSLLPALAWAGGPFQPVLPDEGDRYSLGTVVRSDRSDEWWESLDDEALNSLVREALRANHDVAAAQARFHAAAGVTLQSAAPLLPTASFDVGLNAVPSANAVFMVSPQLMELLNGFSDLASSIPGQQPPAAGDDEEDPELTWNGSALLNLGLNIDLGRSATALRAAQLDAAAARDDRDAVASTIVQQVVASWLDVRAARSRVALIEGQIETNISLLGLTRARFLSSEAGALDVLQQEQQLAATRALLPQSQQLLRLRELQLATLLGQDPSAPELPMVAGLPDLPPQPGLGRPVDLVNERPDLAAASKRLQSARQRLASSALSFAPSFRLSGNVGYQLRWFKEWETRDTWGLGAAVSIPIFGGLQRIGGLKQAVASRNAAARSLSAAALKARAEVETALVREETEGRRLQALEDQLRAARVAYQESSQRYASGLVSNIAVLTALASWQVAELNHLQAQRDLLGARIDLHTALGAPWTGRLNSSGTLR